MSNKINLLHLITGLGVGGAERVVLDLAKNADKSKFNIYVVSLSKKIEMLNDFKRENIEVVSLQKDNSYKDFFQIVLFLNRYIKEHNINIIHAHMTHSMIIAVVIKFMNPKVKIVFTSHNVQFGAKHREVIIYLLKFFRNEDILFSDKQISSIYRKNFKIIPNGVDVTLYQAKKKKLDKFTFLSVGRLEPVKNHLHLLRCAKALKEKNYEFQILIAGQGKQYEKLEKYIQLNHLNSYVTLLGLHFDIAGLMMKSHAFALPSLWEGLPIVLLEAGASSLPVISTPVGTIPSLLDESNGYLTTEDKFCDTMEHVINYYEEAKLKATALYEKVIHEYSIESVVKKHEALYISLLRR